MAVDGLRRLVGWFSGKGYTDDTLDRIRGWVAICLNIRGEAISSLEFKYYEQDPTSPDKKRELSPDHPLVKLFQDPVKDLAWWDFPEVVRMCSTWRAASGAGIIYTPTGVPRENWPGGRPPMPTRMLIIPPPAITMVPPDDSDDPRLIHHWELKTPLGVKRIEPEEICYIPRLGAKADFGASLFEGCSLIREVMAEAKVLEGASDFLVNSFEKGAIPPMVLEQEGSEQGLKEKDFDAWVRKWLERMQGMNGAAPLGVTPPGIKIRQLDLVSNLMGMLGMAKDLQEVVGNGFGIPPGFLHKNATNYATALVENYRFRTDTIEPEAYRICRVLTRHFRQFQKVGERPFMIQHVPFIYEDQAELRAQEKHELDNGIISRDDARAKRGLPAIQGGAVPTVTNGAQVIPVSSIGAASSIPTQKLILQQGDTP